jgi:hypothetical protein
MSAKKLSEKRPTLPIAGGKNEPVISTEEKDVSPAVRDTNDENPILKKLQEDCNNMVSRYVQCHHGTCDFIMVQTYPSNHGFSKIIYSYSYQNYQKKSMNLKHYIGSSTSIKDFNISIVTTLPNTDDLVLIFEATN